MVDNNEPHSSIIEIGDDSVLTHSKTFSQHMEVSSEKPKDQPSFSELRSTSNWWQAIVTVSKTYFPHYNIQRSSGVVQIEERPPWIQCALYGIQHVLAMFSGIIILPLVLGYDSNTTLFFSGLATILFYIVTGGRVPSYLGCSGSVATVILSATGFQSQTSSGLNPNIHLVQGALLILSLVYILVAFVVMFFGYQWLEFLMPPVVTGCIITSIGVQLSSVAYGQITATSFDTYMAIVTAASVMLVSIYAPTDALRRMSILLGTIVGYTVYAICGTKNIGNSIDFSGIKSSPWVQAPTIYFEIEFHKSSISLILPVLVVLLAENLGHMKAIQSIVDRPMMKYVGRAYLGDALGCLTASLGGTMTFTTYAENIGVLSVTQVFSPLVLLFAGIFAMLLGFFAKFSAIVRSIPDGVLGGVTLILYALIAMTGVRIWVINKVDFNDPRNLFVGGVPVILATVIQKPIVMGEFQLDGIGVATFLSIILNQVLIGYEGIKCHFEQIGRIRRQCS